MNKKIENPTPNGIVPRSKFFPDKDKTDCPYYIANTRKCSHTNSSCVGPIHCSMFCPDDKYPRFNSEWSKETTLYIYKNSLICHNEKHPIVSRSVWLVGRDDLKITITNAEYCKYCDKFYLKYERFISLKKEFGILIGNFVEMYATATSLKAESTLHLNGYTVDQRYNLSAEDRQYIIKKLIDMEILTYKDILEYLNFFINTHKNDDRFLFAVAKWTEDLNFVLLQMLKLPPHIIKEIKSLDFGSS